MRILITFFILFSNALFSQTSLLNAEKPSQFENKALNNVNSLEFNEVEENDILWSKVTYEYIDLNEKLNFPLLFPVNDEQNKIGRKSFWRVISEYIIREIDKDSTGASLEIYNTDDFSKFDKLNSKEIRDLISYELVSRKTGTQTLYVKSNEIGGYNIKGIWYFDKKASELKYRLLGLQPVGANTEDLKSGVDNAKRESTYFWIWYPSIRNELNKHLVFNDRNNNNRISFDALLINRRFSSYIYKYDNIYGDRTIRDYIRPRAGEDKFQYQLRLIMESERIKKEILDFEVDMWGY
ncbi:MAG: gliding motility protein GldN [Flavobacteriaceae bacterium]|jgi:gliding motility associated protien GldN